MISSGFHVDTFPPLVLTVSKITAASGRFEWIVSLGKTRCGYTWVRATLDCTPFSISLSSPLTSIPRVLAGPLLSPHLSSLPRLRLFGTGFKFPLSWTFVLGVGIDLNICYVGSTVPPPTTPGYLSLIFRALWTHIFGSSIAVTQLCRFRRRCLLSLEIIRASKRSCILCDGLQGRAFCNVL